MDIFYFIVAIVFIGSFFDYKKNQTRMNTKLDHIEDSAVLNELENVKQRLAVLEKIITDKNYDLNEEFSKLHKSDS
jgi:hypothetical protein